MTTATWLIYLASVSERMLEFFVFFFCVLFFIALVRGGAIACMHDDGEAKDFKIVPWWKPTLLLMFGVPAFLLSLVPSFDTALAMISIELGNDFLHSDEFQRVLDTVIPDKEG